MTWKDNANVCSSDWGSSNVAGAPPESNPAINKPGLAIVINIEKTSQRMRVFVDGVEKYKWAVSTGRPSYFTPSGSYTATSMNEVWYSKEWDDAPMPHSIFFTKDGHAIHGSYEVKETRQARVAWLRAHIAQECRYPLFASGKERHKEHPGRFDRVYSRRGG